MENPKIKTRMKAERMTIATTILIDDKSYCIKNGLKISQLLATAIQQHREKQEGAMETKLAEKTRHAEALKLKADLRDKQVQYLISEIKKIEATTQQNNLLDSVIDKFPQE